MLVIEHLVKDYSGGVRALDDVSIEVHDGEFLVLGAVEDHARPGPGATGQSGQGQEHPPQTSKPGKDTQPLHGNSSFGVWVAGGRASPPVRGPRRML